MDHKYIPGYGPISPRIMILGECPTPDDLIHGKPFSKSRELDMLLKDAGIHKSSCWLTTVSKYHVPPNTGKKRIPFHKRAEQAKVDTSIQLTELQSEINEIKPNCILGIGKTALWALTGKFDINSYRGSILLGMGRKFVPTYNPEHLSWQAQDVEFKGYWNRQIMLFDIKRAALQSHFPEINRPIRTLEICRNSAQAAAFFESYKDFTDASVDIESDGSCAPVCIGIAFNKKHGMTFPLWNVADKSPVMIPTSDLIQIWMILAYQLERINVIGANFNYDRDKLRRIGLIIRYLKDDVMMKAQAINPELPKSLAFNTSIFTEEPFYKHEGMYEGSIQDLFLGCARDACVTYEIAAAMETDLEELNQVDYYRNFLLRLPEMYLDIENEGFAIDPEQRLKLIHKYIEWDERIRYELYKICGTEINVNSPKQIGLLLFENFKLPRRAGVGEEELTALLNNKSNGAKKEEHRKVIELILEGRRVRKSISTYLMALPDFDGRMRTSYFLCLDTGRSSTSQQNVPIRPVIEVVDENGKKKEKSLGIAFQTMTKHGDIGQDIRSMYIPD